MTERTSAQLGIATPATSRRCALPESPSPNGWSATTCPRSSRPRPQTQDVLADPERPTGLFTSQNLVTIGALRTLRAAGLRDRIAHVGFDDVVLADLLEPGLTIVAQDPGEIGRLAATMLFARIDGDRSRARTVVVPTRLIVRGSGELPRI